MILKKLKAVPMDVFTVYESLALDNYKKVWLSVKNKTQLV
jgi:hypothetical protein